MGWDVTPRPQTRVDAHSRSAAMSDHRTYAAFLDTMTYLHYKPVEQIDWHQVLSVSRDSNVRIVVPGVTLREIDKHKNFTPRLRSRAQRVAAQLSSWLADGAHDIRPGLQVVRAIGTPRIDFDAEDLDKASNDDVLVAAALSYQRAHPEITVVLVTQDAYPQTVARARGLVVETLPDDLKLPDEEDAVEKENRDLKRQLQRLQAARPMLTVEFASSTASTCEILVPSVDALAETEIVRAVEVMARKYPTPESFERPVAKPSEPTSEAEDGPLAPALVDALRGLDRARESEFKMFGEFSRKDIARYADERMEFLVKYAKYVQKRRDWERDLARQISLELELVNRGAEPATDVDVILRFPNNVIVTGMDLVGDAPEAPKPPTLPRRTMGSLWGTDPLMGSSLGVQSYLSHLNRPPLEPPNVSSWGLKEAETGLVTCHVRRSKHGLRVALPTMYVMISGEAPIRPFQFNFTLHAANVPDAVTGTLNVLLHSDASDLRGPSPGA